MTDDAVPTTPLSVLLNLMREKWLEGDRDGAAALARAAAPYVHHRLASITRETDQIPEMHHLTDADIERRMESFRKRAGVTEEDSGVTG